MKRMAEPKTRTAEGRGRTFLDRLRLRHAGFRQEESGQALLATGILSLLLLMVATSTMPMGKAVQRRIRAQTAADAAALSAGTWLARGGNMIQAGNAFQYDIHGLAVITIEVITAVYYWKLLVDMDEICSGNLGAVGALVKDWFDGADKISSADRYFRYARELSMIPLKTMHPGYGMLAMAASSETAKQNGAAIINSEETLQELFGAFGLVQPATYEKMHKDATKWLATGEAQYRWWDAFLGILDGIPIVGPWIVKAIQNWCNPDTKFDHYAWTFSPSYSPKTAFAYTESTSFQEWGATPEGEHSPLRCHWYAPFLPTVVFLHLIDWDTKYARLASELHGGAAAHTNTTYTLAVRLPPEPTYYGTLPLVGGWFGTSTEPEVAVSAVRLFNDRLTDSGTPTREYWHCVLGGLPTTPFPLVRMFSYGGDFKTERAPVAFQNGYGTPVKPGTDLLIYH